MRQALTRFDWSLIPSLSDNLSIYSYFYIYYVLNFVLAFSRCVYFVCLRYEVYNRKVLRSIFTSLHHAIHKMCPEFCLCRCVYFYLFDEVYGRKVSRSIFTSRHSQNFASESSKLQVIACVGVAGGNPVNIDMRLKITAIGKFAFETITYVQLICT